MTQGRLFWVVVLLLPLAHLFLHVGLGLGGGVPDLMAVGLLLMSRELPMDRAAGVGFGLGILEDAFSILAFGSNTLAMTLIGIMGSRSRDFFLGDSVPFLLFYLTFGVWLRIGLQWGFAGAGARGSWLTTLGIQAPITAVYAALVGTLLLLLTGAWRAPVD
jgi:rod shape-determining protein MreD